MIKHLSPRTEEELKEGLKNCSKFEKLDMVRKFNFSQEEIKIAENEVLELITVLHHETDDYAHWANDNI